MQLEEIRKVISDKDFTVLKEQFQNHNFPDGFLETFLEKAKKINKSFIEGDHLYIKNEGFHYHFSTEDIEILREIVKKIMQDEDFNALMTKYEVKNNHGIYVGFLLGSLC